MPRCVPINNADVTLRENYLIFACLFSGERRLVSRVNRQMISLPNRWHAKSCKQRRLVTSRKRPSRLYGYILTRCSKCFSVFFSVTPQVLFAQDRFNVLLTVNVGDVSRDSYDIVQLTQISMTFRAVVRSTEFTFSLELFDEIDVDNCQVKSWGSNIVYKQWAQMYWDVFYFQVDIKHSQVFVGLRKKTFRQWPRVHRECKVWSCYD